MDKHKKLSNSNYVLFHHCFDDFDEFASTVQAWDLNFQQLDRGRSATDLSQVISRDVIFSHARFNRHYHQQGSTPAGMRTFALMEDNATGIHWFGREVTPSSLMCFPANGELEAVSRPGFEVYTLSFSERLLNQLVRALGLPDLDMILSNEDNLARCDPHLLIKLRTLLRKATHLVHQGILNDTELEKILQHDLPGNILSALNNASTIPQATPVKGKKLQALLRANEYLRERACEPVLISELCQYADVSLRTLENAFKEYYGVTPKTYLKASRLNGVHKDIRDDTHPFSSITDVANKWGFWHMGQFAADYKRLFDELPSETLRQRPGRDATIR